jgi:hypothetical protein
MIQRIEHGWVQVNENPSRRQRRDRRRPSRPKDQEIEEGRGQKPLIFTATIDLVALRVRDTTGTLFSPFRPPGAYRAWFVVIGLQECAKWDRYRPGGGPCWILPIRRTAWFARRKLRRSRCSVQRAGRKLQRLLEPRSLDQR